MVTFEGVFYGITEADGPSKPVFVGAPIFEGVFYGVEGLHTQPDHPTSEPDIANHCEQAVARLRTKNRTPNLEKLICIFANRWQILEQLLSDMKIFMYFQGVGSQLDLLGERLNEPREGCNDEAYRALLRGKAIARRARGTPDGLIGIVRAILPSTLHSTIMHNESYPAGIIIAFRVPFGEIALGRRIGQMLQGSVRPAIFLQVQFSELGIPIYAFEGDDLDGIGYIDSVADTDEGGWVEAI